MNPMSNVKGITRLNERELELNLAGTATSWHSKYKDSAWIFIGGLPYDLTEGDVICVFSQYGEVVNINLKRDKKTGKSQGYCFLCYQDQRSTILAVDNLNGIKLLGRVIRVDHMEEYKQPKEFGDEDEVTMQVRKEGCAPKIQESESEQEEEELVIPVKKIKKEKKKKVKKEKKKKKKKQRQSSGSSSGEESRDSSNVVKLIPPHKIKKEKVSDSETDSVHRDRGESKRHRSEYDDGRRQGDREVAKQDRGRKRDYSEQRGSPDSRGSNQRRREEHSPDHRHRDTNRDDRWNDDDSYKQRERLDDRDRSRPYGENARSNREDSKSYRDDSRSHRDGSRSYRDDSRSHRDDSRSYRDDSRSNRGGSRSHRTYDNRNEDREGRHGRH